MTGRRGPPDSGEFNAATRVKFTTRAFGRSFPGYTRTVPPLNSHHAGRAAGHGIDSSYETARQSISVSENY